METLQELNREEAKQYIGGVAFVSTCMVIGVIGNLHVLIVYKFRMKKSNPRIFVLFLAALDFITCVVGMPFVIIDLLNPLTFTLIEACKTLRFVNYFVCTSSAFILLIIAIDRYRKVCKPLGTQITHFRAKMLCVVALGISLSISWPAPILYGHSSVNTTNPNITGVRCFTDDRFKNKKYQAYFNELLIFVFFSMFVILVVLYILIARTIAIHEKFRKSFAVSSQTTTRGKNEDLHHEKNTKCFHEIKSISSTVVSTPMSSLPSSPRSSIKREENKEHSETSQSTTSLQGETTHHNGGQKLESKHHHHLIHFHTVKRTTLIMFLISAVFFLSYVPHLCLKIAIFVKKDFIFRMSFSERLLYNTFVWCFFINNIANCFIYGFCDNRFRTELRFLYNKLFCRNK